MRYTLLLIVIAISLNCSGQYIDPDPMAPFYGSYVLYNPVVKKNNIKYIIDSSAYGKPSVKYYDKMGRLIGATQRVADSIDNPYVYIKAGDTTSCLQYHYANKQLICYERFVHKANGQIMNYLKVCRDYLKENNYFSEYVDFYYDELNRLATRLTYRKYDCVGKVSDKAVIKPENLDLYDVLNYTYKLLKNGKKLIIGKQAIGKKDWRNTDTLLYDKTGRLIYASSFAKRGTMGEGIFSNVNNITEYRYTDSSLKRTSYSTYCGLYDPVIGCFEPKITDKEVEILVYNKDKTLNAKYRFDYYGIKFLFDKYEYGYYKD
jgi:hypothetical protein